MILQVISFYLFLATGTSYGCLQLNGQNVTFPSTSPLSTTVGNGFDSEDHAVVSSLQFTCSGQVDAWEAYFEARRRYSNIIFQVWRPMQTSTHCTSYNLVGTNRFTSENIDRSLYGRFVPLPQDVIQFQERDVVGFYVEFANNRLDGPLTSIQTRPDLSVNSITYFNDDLTAENVNALRVLDSCALMQESFVPLLTASITEAIPTTVQPETYSPTTLATSSTSSMPTTENEASATLSEISTQLSTTVETSTQTTQTSTPITVTPPAQTITTSIAVTDDITQSITAQTVETVAEFSTSSTGLSNTMESTTAGLLGTGNELVGSVTEPTSSRSQVTTMAAAETVPLTTLILTIVIVLLVSTAVVVTTVILFRCVWSRLHRKERRHLDLTIPKGASTSNKVFDQHIYSDMELSLSGNSQIYDECKTATSCRTNTSMSIKSPLSKQELEDTYEVPIDSTKVKADRTYGNTTNPSMRIKSSHSNHSKQELENTYEAPIDSVKVQANRTYGNISFGSRNLSSVASPLPALPVGSSEYAFMNPRNTPANTENTFDEDYCNTDGLDTGDQNGLTESNIYEVIHFS